VTLFQGEGSGKPSRVLPVRFRFVRRETCIVHTQVHYTICGVESMRAQARRLVYARSGNGQMGWGWKPLRLSFAPLFFFPHLVSRAGSRRLQGTSSWLATLLVAAPAIAPTAQASPSTLAGSTKERSLPNAKSIQWPCLAQLLFVEKAAYLISWWKAASTCWLLLVYSEKQLNW
jgi:hypothetical protein